MTVLERIKETCRKKKNISITTLEEILGFSNGSLSKAKDIPCGRISKIAEYLEVSTDYLINGEEPSFDKYSDEMTHLYTEIRNDTELSKALLKYFDLSDAKKNHVIELINLLSEV